MKNVARSLAGHLAEIVFLAGAAAVSVGCGLVYLPAGLIAGGVLAMTGAVIAMAGGSEGA